MPRYSTILFDFGGVLAEEGFREGLKAIGRRFGLDPEEIYNLGKDLVYACGYVVGGVGEAWFWDEFRCRTKISATDEELRREILSRFSLRDEMLTAVAGLRKRGYRVAILSDQTNWLDELNKKYGFFSYFDEIFNSFHHGRSKKDPQVFADVVEKLGIRPEEALFLDDDRQNLERAKSKKIEGLLVVESSNALSKLSEILGEELTLKTLREPP
ncbi:HAD family hydrolase [Geoalkalibacter halelectricus]|uniref:HAD family hydrolase n=1 Tax=Geoalkalibacter halelectricus TaxID=2847045 RepID=UPI003D18FF30